MTFRFLVDAQLPPALAERLRALGFTADHVNRIGLGDADDETIWKHATTLGAVLITKDQDFVSLASMQEAGPAVVWIRIGNTTNVALWRSFQPALPELIAALEAGERIIEIR